MAPFFILAVVAVVMVVLLIQEKIRNEEIAKVWAEVGERLGLSFGGLGEASLTGHLDGVPIRVEAIKRSNGKSSTKYTRIAADLRGRLPFGFALAAESRWQLGKVFTGEDVLTGDPIFDEQVNVSGPEATMLACLDSDLRARTAALVQGGLSGVKDGVVYLERRGHLTSATELTEAIRRVATLSTRLRKAVLSVPEGLAANAAKDPLPNVRLHNLTVLLQRHPADAPVVQQAVKAALDDHDPRLRLLAASHHASDEGRAELLRLAGSPSHDAAVRAQALRALGELHAYEQIAFAVAASLESPHDGLQREAVLIAGRAKDASLLPKIALLAARPSEALAEAVAETLGAFDDARAEPALLRLLERPSSSVRRLAAISLGRVGTVNAVEPLLPLTKGVLEGSDLKQAARDAIRRIQARLGDADTGRLSVVTPADTSGAVSLADPTGALSLADAEAPPADQPPAATPPARGRTR